jgi:hypothetical protein
MGRHWGWVEQKSRPLRQVLQIELAWEFSWHHDVNVTATVELVAYDALMTRGVDK